MKTICLIRHAKTEEQEQGQLDFDRELAARGLKDAPEIARLLLEKKIIPDYIVSSPARRAISTAILIAKAYSFSTTRIEQNSLIYNASLTTLFKLIKTFRDEHDTVFMIGHNPAITLLANYLCMKPILHVPTSGVVCFTFDVKKWSDIEAMKGKQKFFIHP
jgi:phosphohistidine phosphatase